MEGKTEKKEGKVRLGREKEGKIGREESRMKNKDSKSEGRNKSERKQKEKQRNRRIEGRRESSRKQEEKARLGR